MNNYCPRGSKAPIPCDNKHTCPWGTELQILCPAGKWVDTSNGARFGAVNKCESCRAGTYSTVQTDLCMPCPAGFICHKECNTATPSIIAQHNGELCPKGHYCPEGSTEAVPCPRGTYNINEGLQKVE